MSCGYPVYRAGSQGLDSSRLQKRLTLTLKVYVPLLDFGWDEGADFELSGFGKIIPTKEVPIQVDQYEAGLSNQDLRWLNTSHWLTWEQQPHYELSSAERMNIFQLALWLAKPTRTQLGYRFEENGTSHSFIRLLDSFHWIPGQVEANIVRTDLEETSSYIGKIEGIRLSNKRLVHALKLTLAGCFARDWQVAYVCFGSASEVILNYGKTKGTTEALAEAYGRIVADDGVKIKFKKLYDVRSDIVHGRTSKLKKDENNITNLREFSNLLRCLWKTILSDDKIMSVLEKNDNARRKWFNDVKPSTQN